jgi:hypothetical protein
MINSSHKYKHKIKAFIVHTVLLSFLDYNNLVAQQFTMSSVSYVSGNLFNSEAIYFKGNTTCLKLESGITAMNVEKSFGEFILNCEINERFNSLGLKLYPVPATTSTNLKFINMPPMNELYNLSIWNTEGVLISSIKETGQNIFHGIKIDISNLSAGSYVIKVASKQNVEAIKFLKGN